jgi:hypothetical protein
VLGLAVLSGACSVDPVAGDPCAIERCVTAPPPLCEGTIKTVFQALGTCTADPTGTARCDYPIAQRQDCALLDGKLCQNGQCVAPTVVPCEGIVCDVRPPPDCDGHVARIYSANGGCDPEIPPAGGCVYGFEAALDCSLSGSVCIDGGCVDPATVPCTPNPCDVPPLGTCSGNIPTSFAPVGTCTEETVDNRPVARCAYEDDAQAPCLAPTPECWLGRCARALAAPSAAGDLVISEISKNPSSQGDDAEWFELYGATDAAMRLDGCLISDEGGESHAIGDDVIVPAGGYLVLGSNLDPRPNGGFVPDYRYDGVILANEADELVLSCGGIQIDRVAWDASWPKLAGRTMSLGGAPPSATANDTASAWCDAPSRYGDGTNLGSPRRANPPCP